ncbi:hypothetical protein B0I37DRAFT_404475 [Chaetomium sp. MPI-CAGE-AT-0009]|nr:hypothetical protein B0I37DRAFT_404475 [Chaetomium sp. MPI-CAGE-AT-0009]
MFTFHEGNRVRTGQSGHAYVFDSMSGESYIFNRQMANGAQSQVQLVTNIETHEVVVQKVSKHRPTVKDGYDLANIPEDNEVRILDHLNALALNPVHVLAGVTPRWSTCISHERVLVEVYGPRPKIQCMQVSYWKFCNASSVASLFSSWSAGFMADDMEGKLFPVCETLHFMYQAGHGAVYQGDLHTGNIFVHYDSHSAQDGLPDFYVGDFGWACTASEDLAESEASYDERGLQQLVRHTVAPWTNTWTAKPPNTPPPSEQAAGLQRLMKMIKFVDAQDELMAARNPRSRPPSLAEVVREARKLEESALRAERGTVHFEMVAKWGEAKLARSKEEAPFVFASQKLEAPPQIQEMKVAQAKKYGYANIEGPWTLVDSE